MSLVIREGGLDHPDVVAMLKFHFDTNIAVTPPGSAHVFDLSRLKQHDVRFWSVWKDTTLVGTGALKRMDNDNGEVKSMHTLVSARRSGIGSAIVSHIIAEAVKMGLKQLWLETGSFEYFRPAVALYAKHDFTECPPFGDYRFDPNSLFMTREIR